MKTKFPAGRYYIGDPCYVLSDQVYDEVLGRYHDFCHAEYEQAGAMEVGDLKVWFADCVEGESDYTDGFNTYSNDTTLLSVIPEALVKPEGPDDNGPIQEFHSDFEVERTGDGTLYIGNLVIDTAKPVDDLSDEWDDDGWDEDEDESDEWDD